MKKLFVYCQDVRPKNSQIQHWDNIPKAKWAPYKKIRSVTEIFNRSQKLPHNSPLAALERIHHRVKCQVERGEPVTPIDDIYNLVSHVDILRIGFAQVKNNRGALTPGSTLDTADDFTNRMLYELSYKLRTGTFEWNPIRRIYVPKPGKPEKRPLGLPDFQDKVVQAAMRIVLETIFEPIFEQHNFNFGFRPHKDPNAALQKVVGLAQGTYHAIEGDIKGAYNDVNHNILMDQLAHQISDHKFLNLVRSSLKAGIMDEGAFEDTFLGIPQGGIVSPLLFNVYMHQFDSFVHNTLPSIIAPTPQPTEISPDYERNRSTVRRITSRLERTTRIEDLSPDPFFEHCSQSAYLQKILPERDKTQLAEKVSKIRSHIKSAPRDRGTLSNWRTSLKNFVLRRLSEVEKTNLFTEYKQHLESVRSAADAIRANTTYLAKKPLKIAYIRYADDWVIFTSGDFETAETIKSVVTQFLKDSLKLTLSLEKTRVTHLHSSKVQFLGFEVYFPTNAHMVRTSRGSTQRYRSIQIHPDTQRLESRFLLKKYVDKQFRPREVGFLTPLTDQEIIRKFNQFMIGLTNYYIRIINYPSRLNRWIYYNYYCCLKTLATKHRLTVSKVIKKYGFKDISNPNLNWFKPNASDLRIAVKYRFNDEDRWEVLLNYKEVMCKAMKLRNPDPQFGVFAQIPTIDFLTLNKVNFRTKFKSETMCAVCNCPSYALHHIRPLKHKGGRYKGFKGFDKIVAALGRKQIPVCKVCHNNIHAGRYDGLSLDDLYDIRLVAPEGLLRFSDSPSRPTGKKSSENSGSSGANKTDTGKSPSFVIDESARTYFSSSLNKFYLTTHNYEKHQVSITQIT